MVGQRGLDAWLVVAVVATGIAVAGAFDATWRLVNGDFGGLLVLPIALVFWAWIAGGALRRRSGQGSTLDPPA